MKPQVTPSGLILPGQRKEEGGSIFDDEMESAAGAIKAEAREMVKHLNERPDHIVYVPTAEERTQMRAVFNYWKSQGWIGHNPNIRIEYALSNGAIRVGE